MTITNLSAASLAAQLTALDISSVEATQACLDRIADVDGEINAFLALNAESALAVAKSVDDRRAAGEQLPELAGVPVACKDILATKDLATTCGSRILDGWRPPYNATVVDKLNAALMPIIGKTNMDEFAMGSSTEHSAFGPTRNPWDKSKIPGGSGGGSAAAVAALEVPLAIGTDTGGSIRQPAAVTGTVGVKPTYGAVSRYGLVALASSLDQAGPCARTVMDAALLHEVIAGHDPRDSTSLPDPAPDVVAAARRADVTGQRIGVIKQLNGSGYQEGVRQRFDEAVQVLTNLGADVVEVSCPSFEYALAAYYLILPSEASSNLAKFDGMRYGLREMPTPDSNVAEVMSATREAGFGAEVKRRIMLGTYALSSGYYDEYYGKAQQVRTLVQQDFARAFADCDVLISPTTPTTAFGLGEKLADPVAMYLNDIATIPVNLAGNAALSMPIGLSPTDNLPVGLQIIAPQMADDRLYNTAAAVEDVLEDAWGRPLIEELVQ